MRVIEDDKQELLGQDCVNLSMHLLLPLSEISS